MSVSSLFFTCFDVLKFILLIFGSEAWGNKTKEMYYSLLILKMISFASLPQALEPSMNFNVENSL